MTCPDCRSNVTQQPVPSYTIREMTMIFLSRHELLPDGETKEEHEKWAKEEADIVANDKADQHPRTGGLFKGRFRHGATRHFMPIYDHSDHVDRCPACLCEVEDGFCNHCGVPVGEDYDSEWGVPDGPPSGMSSDSELDDELDEENHMEDHDAAWGAYPDDEIDYHEEQMHVDDEDRVAEMLFGGGRPWINRRRFASEDVEEDEEDEEEDDTNLDGFIVDEEEEDEENRPVLHSEESDDGSDSDAPPEPRHRAGFTNRRRGGPIVIDEDDEDEDEDDREEDDDTARGQSVSASEQSTARGAFGRKRNAIVRSRARPALPASDDEESSEEEDEDGDEEGPYARPGVQSHLGYERDSSEVDQHGTPNAYASSDQESEDVAPDYDFYNNYQGAQFSDLSDEEGRSSDEEDHAFAEPNTSSYWQDEEDDYGSSDTAG